MTNWKEKIDIHSVLSKANEKYDLSDLEMECPAEVKEELAAEVEKSSLLFSLGKKIRKAITIYDVNDELENVFDAADHHKVWCGMPL